jgi:hypothetical protein
MDHDWPAEFLRARTHIQRVQPMDIIGGRAADFLRSCHHVKGHGGGIDHGRAGDAEWRIITAQTDIAAGHGRHAGGRIDETNLPKGRGIAAGVAVGVEGKNAVVFGGGEDNVVRAFVGNSHRGHIKRLGINLAIDGAEEQQAESVGVDVSDGEIGLADVLACPRHIVVISQHIDLGRRGERGHGRPEQGAEKSAATPAKKCWRAVDVLILLHSILLGRQQPEK